MVRHTGGGSRKLVCFHFCALGTYGILWQIEAARRLDLAHVYLGYWIAESPKMAYKSRFRPLEALIDGDWVPLPAQV